LIYSNEKIGKEQKKYSGGGKVLQKAYLKHDSGTTALATHYKAHREKPTNES
jgi:hypothetical protein